MGNTNEKKPVKFSEVANRQYITLKEAMSILDIKSETTARKYIRDRILPAEKIGGKWKINTEAMRIKFSLGADSEKEGKRGE